MKVNKANTLTLLVSTHDQHWHVLKSGYVSKETNIE